MVGRSDIPVHPSMHGQPQPGMYGVSPDIHMMEGQADELGDEDDDEEVDYDSEDDDRSGVAVVTPSTGVSSNKRPSSGPPNSSGRNAKAAKLNGDSPTTGGTKGKGKGKGEVGPDGKSKATRGSRACTVCRRLKMRCLPAEDGGPPCKRCRHGGHECIFEESQRGKRSTKRTDLLARNLKTMEEKLDLVMSKMQPGQSPPTAPVPLPSTSSGLPHMPMAGTSLSAAANASPNTPWAALHQAAASSAAPSPSLGHSPDYGLPPVLSSSMSSAPNTVPTGINAITSSAGMLHPVTSQAHSGASPYGSSPAVAGQPMMSPDQGPTLLAAGSSRSPQGRHAHFAKDTQISRPPSPRLHSLPDNTLNPLGLLAEASLHSRHRHRRRSSSGRRDGDPNGDASDGTASDSGQGSSNGAGGGSSGIGGAGDSDRKAASRRGGKVGVANQAYFQPGPMNILPLRRIVIEQRMPPSLLTDKVLSSEEAVELFQIYFERCNPHCCILEPDMHTPTLIGSRSPFLFTAVCAVASKFYPKRRDLHPRCLGAAKRCAFDVLIKGYKSVEIVQALLLLSLWNQPAERFEEDRTWAFSGIAIRMAQDLNLHRKTTAKLPSSVEDGVIQQYERELLNRERTWLYCFIIDRSLSAQMGKPYSVREDFIVRSSKTWWKQRCSSPQDYGLVAMVDLLRIFSRIIDTIYSDTRTVSGINDHLDYSLLMRTFSQSLDSWAIEWTPTAAPPSPEDIAGSYRHNMKEFFFNYYRLFTMSFMLQHALDNPDRAIELPQTFARCYDAASRVIAVVRDHLAPSGALRYAPDNHFVYISYAAVFLMKLIRPEFRGYSDQSVMIQLVQDIIDVFDKVAVDETHTPSLYATFLRMLVNSKQASNAPSRAQRASADGVPPGEQNQPTPEQLEDALRRTQMGQYHGQPASNGDMPPPQSTAALGDAFSDNLLSNGRMLDGFWDSMLMPGYSGPLDGLSGGSGIVSQFQGDGGNAFGFTPAQSGRTTPVPFFTQGSLDFGGDLLGTPHMRIVSHDGTPHLQN